MPALEIDYVPFATEVGANVYLPATYQALAVVGTGVEPGLADPQLANTTWRLSSMISAAIATFISNSLGIAVLDDGNLPNLVSELSSAVAVSGSIGVSRTITSSANFNIIVSDYALAMDRTTAPAATVATLPSTAVIGQKFRVCDLAANFAAFNVTVAAPAGHNISLLTEVILNVNRQSAEFEYHGNSTWSVLGVF
jgi:hypothetical protein